MHFAKSSMASRQAFIGILVLFMILISAELSFAAQIMKIQGKRVLIDLKNSNIDVQTGKKFFVLVAGKRKAIVQVDKVSGTRAIGTILKGRAAVGGTLAAPPPSAGKKSAVRRSAPPQDPSQGFSSFDDLLKQTSFGVTGGLSMDTQDITLPDSEISMTGSGLSLRAFADAPLYEKFGVILRLGLEQFNVETTTGENTFTTEINYLTGDLLLRYRFMEGDDFTPYIFGGGGVFYPLSKSTNALQIDDLTATSVFYGGAGLNYSLQNGMYLTATGEGGLWLPEESVLTYFLNVRGGVGLRF